VTKAEDDDGQKVGTDGGMTGTLWFVSGAGNG